MMEKWGSGSERTCLYSDTPTLRFLIIALLPAHLSDFGLAIAG
jgi:hypothetical protein